MFNAEQLLNKVMSEVMDSKKHKKKYKKHKKDKKYKNYKKHKSDNMLGSLTSSMTSGKGLVAAIGLGVGAYAIYKSKSTNQGVAGNTPGTAQVPPGQPVNQMPQGQMPPPVPPIPQPQASVPASTQVAALPVPEDTQQSIEDDAAHDLALRLIQVMIASAYADGQMDAEEEKEILGTLQERGLTSEEKRFMLTELHNPQSIEALTAGVADPRVAQTMYSLAVSTIVVDTTEERAWLDDFASALSLSEQMKEFIEEDG